MSFRESFTRCCDAIGRSQDKCASVVTDFCTCGPVRIVFNAPLTLWFEGICLAVWFIKSSTKNHFVTELFRSPARFEVERLTKYPLSIPRFFLHVFGHGDWNHFFGNTTSLLLVLPMLEEKYKARWLVCISILNAFAAAVLNICLTKATVVLGASGIVFQCMLLAVFSGRYHAPGDIPMTFLLAIVVYIVPEVQGFGSKDGVSHMAHLVGGAVGAAAAFCAQGHARTSEEVHRTAARTTVMAPNFQPHATQMTAWRYGP
mmetsp:Transcript_4028/g.7325  ORF Transcript_4028/g.7325 Transcript_4028/m.7325 type:complete len:259 (-) Transcript_4028:128-904(-)